MTTTLWNKISTRGARYGVLGALIWGMTLSSARAQHNPSVQGTYYGVLEHEATHFYQYAVMTLSTVNSGGGVLKISANVRILYGDWESSEFLTYDYPDVPLNILTRQMSFREPTHDVSFVGALGDGEITGDWYASSVGRVGRFHAIKGTRPAPPEGFAMVRTLTGRYQGRFKNTHPEASLPERWSLALVTTQDLEGGHPVLMISGNLRLYLGAFDSLEYYETPLKDVQFNFYNRYLTVKTQDYGLTLKGILSLDGVFRGQVFADGLGLVGTTELKATPAL